MPGQHAARFELADPEPGVHRADRRPDLVIDGGPASDACGGGGPLGRTEVARLGGPGHEVPGLGHAIPFQVAALSIR